MVYIIYMLVLQKKKKNLIYQLGFTKKKRERERRRIDEAITETSLSGGDHGRKKILQYQYPSGSNGGDTQETSSEVSREVPMRLEAMDKYYSHKLDRDSIFDSTTIV